MIQIGDFKLHIINDGLTRVDPGGMFGLVPRVLWSRYFDPDENQLIKSNENCLIIQTGEQKILVDTGLSNRFDAKANARWHVERPQGDLLIGLERIGLTPTDIDIVINTHLHSDHCSGNVVFAEDNQTLIPAYPNAEYVVQRREYEDATHPNERTAATYLPENWDVLLKSGQMRLLDGDTVIAPGIMGVVTPGHTPGHMSVMIESQGQNALFLSDLASMAVHFERLAWMTAYDLEPLITLETKRRWQQWALQNDAVLIFPHEPERPIGRLFQLENGKPQIDAFDIPLD